MTGEFKLTKRMTVGRIEKEDDRTLIYASATPISSSVGEYRVIASASCAVRVGDTILYEPVGINFGWLYDDAEEQNSPEAQSQEIARLIADRIDELDEDQS